MCLGKLSNLARKEAWVADDSKRTIITLPWMLAHGAGTLRVMDELRAKEGTWSQQVYYRTAATRTDRPDSWTAGGTARTSNGRGVQDISLAGVTGKLWIQAALRASSVADGTGEGLSSVQASTEGKGRVIAARTLNIQPVVNSGEAIYIPLSKPHPAQGLESYMFAVILEGVDGTVTYQPAWRPFTAGLDNPGGWNDIGSSGSSADSNSGVLSVSPGTVLYAQPGLKITSTGGRAQARVLVSAV